MSWLPAEVWCLICRLLQDDRPALSSLCRTSKSLRDFAQPALYAHYDIYIGPKTPRSWTTSFLHFYRTVLETPRLAALVTFLQLAVSLPAEEEVDDQSSSSTAEEVATLLGQAMANRFHFGYSIDLVVKRKWGATPLVGFLPFLLPNVKDCRFDGAQHHATFRLVRCLHRGGCLPPLGAVTHMTLLPDWEQATSCGRPNAFRLSSMTPLLELVPNLQELTLYGCQGHEPTHSRRYRSTTTSTRREEGGALFSPPPMLPKFPASLQSLQITYGHFNAAELAHTLSECRNLRSFTYVEGGPARFKPASIENYHDITPGQVVEALRSVVRDTLERLELNLGCTLRLRDIGGPRLIRGNLGDAFPHLVKVSLNAEDLLWIPRGVPRSTAAIEDTGGGGGCSTCCRRRRCASSTSCGSIRSWSPTCGGSRFPRLRTLRVHVVPEDPKTVCMRGCGGTCPSWMR